MDQVDVTLDYPAYNTQLAYPLEFFPVQAGNALSLPQYETYQ